MVTIVALRRRLKICVVSAPSSRPIRASRNENSADWARPAPIRMASRNGEPSQRAMTVVTAPLTMTMSTTVMRTSAHDSTRNLGSRSIPMETKKTPEKTSRRGLASPRTLWARSDSPTTTPVRNAPSAIETPSSEAPPAIARATVMTASAKNSGFRTAVARRRSQGRAKNASGIRTKKNSAALPRSGPTARSCGERNESAATSTTVEMSWTEDHARPSCAWRLSSSPRSERIFPSTVLDEFEITAPNA